MRRGACLRRGCRRARRCAARACERTTSGANAAIRAVRVARARCADACIRRARRSQTPCICSAGADEAAARKRARPESHARAFASIRFITPANPWTIPFFHVLPTPPPAHRRPSRSFACIGRRALAAFVGCFVGCFADNSWLRSTAAHEAWRACVAPARGAVACRPIARLRARVRRRRFGSRPNIGALYTARAVSNVVLIELIFNKER